VDIHCILNTHMHVHADRYGAERVRLIDQWIDQSNGRGVASIYLCPSFHSTRKLFVSHSSYDISLYMCLYCLSVFESIVSTSKSSRIRRVSSSSSDSEQEEEIHSSSLTHVIPSQDADAPGVNIEVRSTDMQGTT
jgi:hypothetical protein